jgi:hypothetical protein
MLVVADRLGQGGLGGKLFCLGIKVGRQVVSKQLIQQGDLRCPPPRTAWQSAREGGRSGHMPERGAGDT